ncbi:MAG TPA: hypothetical protein VHZ31_00485 [Solirubrobacteraceae bacterium]|jgi:hypothetical protein|nr:hypothetical protein [Solirubrobacteraceae bacterium]
MTASADVVAPFHDMFVASAGVAGALIGLLFVAISVAPHRVTGDAAEHAHRIRASAALVAFTNALTISLFALIPGVGIGITTIVVGVFGLLFVASSLLSVLRLRRSTSVAFRHVTFLAGLCAVFVIEAYEGLRFEADERSDPVSTIAVVIVVCFLIGIARSWELIGATRFGLASEVVATMRQRDRGEAPPVAQSDPATGDGGPEPAAGD